MEFTTAAGQFVAAMTNSYLFESVRVNELISCLDVFPTIETQQINSTNTLLKAETSGLYLFDNYIVGNIKVKNGFGLTNSNPNLHKY